jgi:hypothetical protein
MYTDNSSTDVDKVVVTQLKVAHGNIFYGIDIRIVK